jgi:hypothetical protein
LIVAIATDPFRLGPWLLLAYYAPSRIAAAIGGIVTSVAAWGFLRAMSLLPATDVDYFALAIGCVLGVAIPALLWGPFHRIRTARKSGR